MVLEMLVRQGGFLYTCSETRRERRISKSQKKTAVTTTRFLKTYSNLRFAYLLDCSKLHGTILISGLITLGDPD